MSNGKVMIAHLIAGLIKKYLVGFYWLQLYKNESIFLNRVNHLVGLLTLKLIFQIMQQKQTLKIFHMLILQVLH